MPAAAAVAVAAAATLTSSLTLLATPRAWTNISWSNPSARSGDWLTIRCAGSDTYFSWVYTDGSKLGSMPFQLFSGGSTQSSCSAINVAMYSNNAVVAATADIPVEKMIEQVHISLTSDPSVVVVDFVSTAAGTAPSCSFGETPALGSTAAGNATAWPTIGSVAYAVLTGLKPATTYYYACTDGVAVSETFSFVNRPANAVSRIAVFADFGVDDGFGLDQIAADADAGAFDLILHAGDWAYNFESANSANGNIFMNRAMTYSTRFPVQPAPGNHEASANFGEYKVRHSGVAASSNTRSNMFYSFETNAGTPLGVHYLVFNSETYVQGGIADQIAFMKADLAAVDRKRTPWVFAYSHKHWWMDSTDFSEMTGVLADGKVDILFAGHWHYYQRMLPLVPTTPWKVDSACASADNHTYVDPLYTTMIVSGAVGDVERNDSCPGDASLNRVTTACSAAYGYGIVTVQSATELRWDFSAWSTPIGDTGMRAPVDYTDYVVIRRSQPPA